MQYLCEIVQYCYVIYIIHIVRHSCLLLPCVKVELFPAVCSVLALAVVLPWSSCRLVQAGCLACVPCPRSDQDIITRTLDTEPSHFSQPATQLMSLMAWLARNKNFILLIYNSMSVVTPWYKRSEVKGR